MAGLWSIHFTTTIPAPSELCVVLSENGESVPFSTGVSLPEDMYEAKLFSVFSMVVVSLGGSTAILGAGGIPLRFVSFQDFTGELDTSLRARELVGIKDSLRCFNMPRMRFCSVWVLDSFLISPEVVSLCSRLEIDFETGKVPGLLARKV